MASESLLELHEAYPFLFYFFSLEKKGGGGVGGRECSSKVNFSVVATKEPASQS